MEHTEDNTDNQKPLLLSFLKVFETLKTRIWYDKEKNEENMVANIGIRCRNCGKITGFSAEINIYKDIVTKLVLNKVIKRVVMSWIIETNQKLKYGIDKYNPDRLTNGPWYEKCICTKLHGTVFENNIINERTYR